MTWVRNRCPECELPVAVDAPDVVLVLYPDERRDYYTFRCPQCGQNIYWVADAADIQQLLQGPIRIVKMPPVETSDAPPLEIDLMIDFGLEEEERARRESNPQPPG